MNSIGKDKDMIIFQSSLVERRSTVTSVGFCDCPCLMATRKSDDTSHFRASSFIFLNCFQMMEIGAAIRPLSGVSIFTLALAGIMYWCYACRANLNLLV